MPAFPRLTDWYMVMQTACREFILKNDLSVTQVPRKLIVDFY